MPEKLFSIALSPSHKTMLMKIAELYRDETGFKIHLKAVAEKAISDLYKKSITPLAEGE